MVTKAQIEKYLEDLSSGEYYDEEEGCHYLRKGYQSGVCTDSSRLIAKKFGGKVFGYYFKDSDPNTFVGRRSASGHDFAVVGKYLVDWWGKNMEGTSKGVYDLSSVDDLDEIKLKYPTKERWSVVSESVQIVKSLLEEALRPSSVTSPGLS